MNWVRRVRILTFVHQLQNKKDYHTLAAYIEVSATNYNPCIQIDVDESDHGTRTHNKPNQFINSLKFDLIINLLNLINELKLIELKLKVEFLK